MSEEDERSITSSEATSNDDTLSDDGSEPTPEEQTTAVDTVTQWVDNFHIESDMAPQPPSVTTAPAGDTSGIKVNAPAEFTGARGTFEAFRMQCLLAIEMGGNKLSSERKQVLYIVSFLRGPAYDWVHPHFKDFLQHSASKQKEYTKKLFKDYESLFDEMEDVFDNGNEAIEAERDIRALRQKTSAAKYRADFQILASKIEWNDEALASQFYRGLKDRVREEITIRHERPSTLKEMAELAIKIDNRIFELQLERSGNYSQKGKSNTKAKREVPAWRDDYYGLQKMQLDATQGKPGSRGQKKGPQQRKSKDKSQAECYGCGKKGHYKNECRARKQSHELQKSGRQESFKATKGPGSTKEEPKPATIAATSHNWTYEDTTQGRGAYDLTGTNAQDTQDGHELMSWTACYNDSCAIHLSDKMGSGYFPSRRRQSICLTRGMPDTTAAARQALVRLPTPEIEELSLDGSTPEESEEEDNPEEDSSESEGSVPGEHLKLAYYMPMGDILPRILDRLMNRKQEVFPWIDGMQYIHDDKFGQVLSELRHIVINMPVVEHSVNYHSIVREWPPVGSDFSPRGGYTTPDGVTITKTMRDKVKALKLEYGSRGEQNLHRQRITPLSPRAIRQETERPHRAARFAGTRAIESDNRLGPRSEGSETSGGVPRTNHDSEN